MIGTNRKLDPRAALAALVLLLFAAGTARAQTTTATLAGRVLDSTGAALPRVQVEVTGARAAVATVTDESGACRLTGLPPGRYRVTFRREGFAPVEYLDVALAVDQTLHLEATLRPAAAGQVEVTAAAPVLDLTTAALKHRLDTRTIDALPLDGRNFLDLVRLAPGVTATDRGEGESRDTRGSILGERAGNIGYLVDGIANDDDFRGGWLAPFTQDAVEEFEVIETGYRAEFGGGSGGIVNVLTRSGSDRHEGRGFLFFRDDALDASNVSGQDAPELGRSDYGLTAGGPVRPGRSWYFVSLEHHHERRGATFAPDVPASLAAGQDFSATPTADGYQAFAKWSQSLGDAHRLEVSLAGSSLSERGRIPSPAALPSAGLDSDSRTYRGTVRLRSALRPGLTLESALGVRTADDDRRGRGAGSVGIYFLDDGAWFDVGPPAGSVGSVDQRHVTLREVVSLEGRARHGFKLGADYTLARVDGTSAQALTRVVATTHELFDRYGLDSFQIPQGAFFAAPGDERMRLRNHAVALFGQDTLALGRGVTADAGLRWERDSRFPEVGNLAPRLGLAWTPDRGKTKLSSSFGLYYDRYRLGLAQPVRELGGTLGRTLVELDYPRLAADALLALPGSLGAIARAVGDPLFLHRAFGIAPDAVVTRSTVEGLTGLAPEAFVEAVNRHLASLGEPFIPVGFSPATGYLSQDQSAAFADEVRVARPFRTPFNRTFTLGIERELGAGLAAGAAWVHRDIRNILGIRLTNLSAASGDAGGPITTDGGPLQRSYGPWYRGQYRALVLSFTGRRPRWAMQASYTCARATDNLLNSNLLVGLAVQGGGAVPTDNLDLDADRGNSDLVVPHGLVVSGVVDLGAGLRLGGVLRATSGFWFSAAGEPVDWDGDGIVSSRPRETRRNQFRGPASCDVDLRIEKRFGLGRRSVSALAEVFNLTNARNPRLVNNPWVDGAPGPGFGSVRVALPGREVQLGLRFEL